MLIQWWCYNVQQALANRYGVLPYQHSIHNLGSFLRSPDKMVPSELLLLQALLSGGSVIHTCRMAYEELLKFSFFSVL